MTLPRVFSVMQEYIVGRMSHDEAVARLDLEPGTLPARRLTVYRNSYVTCVAESAAHVFPVTHRVILGLVGDEGWQRLAAALGTEHPMPEIRFGTAALVPFLTGPFASELGLPPWLSELADLELWERRVFTSPDVAPRDGLAVTEPLALRTYRFDVIAPRIAPDPTIVSVRERKLLVAIWRKSDGLRYTKPLGPLELRLLQAVRKDGPVGLSRLVATGELGPHAIDATRHLAEAEILRGPLPVELLARQPFQA